MIYCDFCRYRDTCLLVDEMEFDDKCELMPEFPLQVIGTKKWLEMSYNQFTDTFWSYSENLME
jgi:hypothetical protein